LIAIMVNNGGGDSIGSQNMAQPKMAKNPTSVRRDLDASAFVSKIFGLLIDRYMRANEGFLRSEDLAAHRSEWVEPASTSYRGYDVWELPPNTQGIAALQMLNVLESYDLAKVGAGSADYLHLFLEAKKLAFEDRARFYADPAFGALPVSTSPSSVTSARATRRCPPSSASRAGR